MLRANDFFEHVGSFYQVESVSPSSASVRIVKGKDRLGNAGQVTNISVNSDVRILSQEETESVLSRRESDGRTKGRGRPKGSKNKSHSASDLDLLHERSDMIKKRGRPKGSTNKPKESASEKEVVAVTTAPKKRGRPKGSKNKPKS